MPHKDPDARRRYARERSRLRRAAARAERLSALEVPWRGPDREAAWAAGMFEGEGTVTILSAGTRHPLATKGLVTLTSVDPATVRFYLDRWGGRISTRQPSGNARLAHVWSITGPSMYTFLHQLRPYLVREAVVEKFDVVMEDYRLRQQGQRRAGYYDRLAATHQRVRELNHRGSLPRSADVPASR